MDEPNPSAPKNRKMENGERYVEGTVFHAQALFRKMRSQRLRREASEENRQPGASTSIQQIGGNAVNLQPEASAPLQQQIEMSAAQPVSHMDLNPRRRVTQWEFLSLLENIVDGTHPKPARGEYRVNDREEGESEESEDSFDEFEDDFNGGEAMDYDDYNYLMDHLGIDTPEIFEFLGTRRTAPSPPPVLGTPILFVVPPEDDRNSVLEWIYERVMDSQNKTGSFGSGAQFKIVEDKDDKLKAMGNKRISRLNVRNFEKEPPILEEFEQMLDGNKKEHPFAEMFPSSWSYAMIAYTQDPFWMQRGVELPAGISRPPFANEYFDSNRAPTASAYFLPSSLIPHQLADETTFEIQKQRYFAALDAWIAKHRMPDLEEQEPSSSEPGTSA